MSTPMTATQPTFIPEAEPMSAGGAQIRLVAGVHTGADVGAIDYLAPPGFAPPPVLHRHTREDANWLVLDGAVEFAFADGATVRVRPGDSMLVPKGCWFRWRNPDPDRSVRMICWFSPAGFEQFFVDVATSARVHLADGGTPESFAPLLLELRARYGDESHVGGQDPVTS